MKASAKFVRTWWWGLFCNILLQANSHIEGFVHLTNHLVDVPSDPYARWLWIPAYAENARHDLHEFVDRIGEEWFAYQEKLVGAYDDSRRGDDLNISGARPIT